MLAERWPLWAWSIQAAVPAALVLQGVPHLASRGFVGGLRQASMLAGGLWIVAVAGSLAVPAVRRWLVAHRYQLLLSLASTLIALVVVGELAVRSLTRPADLDGNRKFRTIVLKPYRLPWRSAQAEIDRYLGTDETSTVFDPDLGWAPRPQRTSQWYAYNERAIRVARLGDEYAAEPPPGVMRIALCGDSFTQGAEVDFADTWGAQLEKLLSRRGKQVEVLNLGVGGYGMDQAYLRWQKHARPLKPHLVLFGFQPENVHRNVNLIRRLYQVNSGNPLSKPRFIETPRGLELINRPCIPPDKLSETIRHLDRWPLVRYEELYDPRNYESHWWQASLLVQVAVDVLGRDPTPDMSLDVPRVRLALEIVRKFAQDVAETGAQFAVVHLPAQPDLQVLRATGSLAYAQLATAMAKDCRYIATEQALLDAARQSSLPALFMPQGHYSPSANSVVAAAVAAALADAL